MGCKHLSLDRQFIFGTVSVHAIETEVSFHRAAWSTFDYVEANFASDLSGRSLIVVLFSSLTIWAGQEHRVLG